ncbi:MAG TPA: NAD(P)-dependent alcohol dehydrogenase [Solirubrobacterales bacterium]|nr:NAD(P)-dependent alcohol dehydrogenase [Solirubrobacterales bacterium]
MPQTSAFGATAADQPLTPLAIERREPGPRDVAIDILYCGVCHSDLHFVRGEWDNESWPIVPGHEIVGRVSAVGEEVEGFAVGDLAGVGCMVDSCRTCSACEEDLEQFCENGNTLTYGSVEPQTGGTTQGGYSTAVVVDQDFCLHVSEDIDLAATAPLLCAGITTYSPLRHWNVGPDSKVGVVGLGGLGHMAVKIAKAMGAEVTLFTTTPGKAEDARALGADHVVMSKDREQMKGVAGTLDLILDSVAAPHDLDAYFATLARNGSLVLLGVPAEPHPSPKVHSFIRGRRSLSGSLIGGIAETQEMLDFCAEHGVTADVEMIPMDQIDEAYDRMESSDVKFRFVIDMESMPAAA